MVSLVILVAASLIGASNAHFKCLRNISCYDDSNTILDLQPIASLESICLDFCHQANCSKTAPTDLIGKLAGGVAGAVSNLVSGPLQCLLDPNGDGKNPNQVSNYQACVFPCILNLNLLNVCDIQAIVTTLVKVCPDSDRRGLCLSACLCCGKEEEPLDVCVNLCLSNQGIDLSIKPADIPLLGGVLGGKSSGGKSKGGKSGIHVLHLGGKSSEEKKGGLLGGLVGDIDILGSHSGGKSRGSHSKQRDQEATTQQQQDGATTPCA
jgi:hypothetical protein